MAPQSYGFHVALNIEKLVHAPFDQSRVFVKWKTAKKKQSGLTPLAEVLGHVCTWESSFSFDISLRSGKHSSFLKPCQLRFSVREAGASASDSVAANETNNFTRLGVAEFDIASIANQRSSSHRILLQETKSNAVLQFRVDITQISGPPGFHCPASLDVDSAGPRMQQGTDVDPTDRTGVQDGSSNMVESMDDILRRATQPDDMHATHGDGKIYRPQRKSGKCSSNSSCCSGSPRDDQGTDKLPIEAEGSNTEATTQAQIEQSRVPASSVVDGILGDIFGPNPVRSAKSA